MSCVTMQLQSTTVATNHLWRIVGQSIASKYRFVLPRQQKSGQEAHDETAESALLLLCLVTYLASVMQL